MPPSRPEPSQRRFEPWAVSLLLATVTVALYAATRDHGFVLFDDDLYVTDNPVVKRGLSWETVAWAFRATEAANWHPVTWLSHLADVSLFGVSPGGHHATSVLFHAANTVLLFAFLRLTTGALWRSAFAAALFSVHPLHVESVAWVSERKDVLSTFFWFLALIAWARYARAPSAWRYAAVSVLFALGLMSKPMVVTLPATLLLVDIWPLQRWTPGRDPVRLLWPLVREKLPLVALSLAASLITVVAQSRGGAVASSFAIPFADRASNALISYVVYGWKTLWPTGLAAFYPHRGLTGPGIPSWQVAGAAGVLVALSVLALHQRRRRPYLAFGWLWYLGTLVPVIGLVQVGMQARADRYMYVPQVGLLIAIVWGVHELAGSSAATRRIAASAGGIALCVLAATSWLQIDRWKDHETLFRHTIAVTRDNSTAHCILAAWLGMEGRSQEALAHAREAARLWPENVRAWQLASAALRDERAPREAVTAAREAVRLAPSNAESWRLLALALRDSGELSEASDALAEAIRMAPDHAPTWTHVASVEVKAGNVDRAVSAMREAVRLDPDDARSWFNLGVVEGMAGRSGESIEAYRRAVHLNPRYTAAWRNLGVMYERAGRPADAARAFDEAERSLAATSSPTTVAR